MTDRPSPFYKCPHCGHILLKDAMMMSLAATGAAVGILGGGCPDCRSPLDAGAVYIAGRYDISAADIVHGNYGKEVLAAILAAQHAAPFILE